MPPCHFEQKRSGTSQHALRVRSRERQGGENTGDVQEPAMHPEQKEIQRALYTFMQHLTRTRMPALDVTGPGSGFFVLERKPGRS